MKRADTYFRIDITKNSVKSKRLGCVLSPFFIIRFSSFSLRLAAGSRLVSRRSRIRRLAKGPGLPFGPIFTAPCPDQVKCTSKRQGESVSCITRTAYLTTATWLTRGFDFKPRPVALWLFQVVCCFALFSECLFFFSFSRQPPQPFPPCSLRRKPGLLAGQPIIILRPIPFHRGHKFK